MTFFKLLSVAGRCVYPRDKSGYDSAVAASLDVPMPCGFGSRDATGNTNFAAPSTPTDEDDLELEKFHASPGHAAGWVQQMLQSQFEYEAALLAAQRLEEKNNLGEEARKLDESFRDSDFVLARHGKVPEQPRPDSAQGDRANSPLAHQQHDSRLNAAQITVEAFQFSQPDTPRPATPRDLTPTYATVQLGSLGTQRVVAHLVSPGPAGKTAALPASNFVQPGLATKQDAVEAKMPSDLPVSSKAAAQGFFHSSGGANVLIPRAAIAAATATVAKQTPSSAESATNKRLCLHAVAPPIPQTPLQRAVVSPPEKSFIPDPFEKIYVLHF